MVSLPETVESRWPSDAQLEAWQRSNPAYNDKAWARYIGEVLHASGLLAPAGYNDACECTGWYLAHSGRTLLGSETEPIRRDLCERTIPDRWRKRIGAHLADTTSCCYVAPTPLLHDVDNSGAIMRHRAPSDADTDATAPVATDGAMVPSPSVTAPTSLAESSTADQPPESTREGEAQAAPAVSHWVVDAGQRYWHQSALADFYGCGIKYRYRYLDRIQTPPTPNLIRGRLGHHAIEILLKGKIDGEEIGDGFLAETIASEMALQWEGVRLTDDEKAEGDDKTRERVLRHVWLGLDKFRRELLPELNPVVVEQRFKFQTDYGFGLAGAIDLIEPDRITDWKWTGKSPAQNEADSSVQLSIYGIAYTWLYPGAGLPSSYRLGKIVVSPKREDVSIKLLETTRTVEDFTRALRYIAHAQATLDKGVFMPARPGDWLCTPQFCDYWDRCAFGAAGRVR